MPQRECEDYYDNDGSVTDTMMCAKSYKGMKEKSSSSDLLGLKISMNSKLSCTDYQQFNVHFFFYLAEHTIYSRNDMGQKCEGNCG